MKAKQEQKVGGANWLINTLNLWWWADEVTMQKVGGTNWLINTLNLWWWADELTMQILLRQKET